MGMASPVKKDSLKVPEIMESNVVIDSNDSSETLTDEEVVGDENLSKYMGAKLILFEHSYMKNYNALFDWYDNPQQKEKIYNEEIVQESNSSLSSKILLEAKISSKEEKACDSEKEQLVEAGELKEPENECPSMKLTVTKELCETKNMLPSEQLTGTKEFCREVCSVSENILLPEQLTGTKELCREVSSVSEDILPSEQLTGTKELCRETNCVSENILPTEQLTEAKELCCVSEKLTKIKETSKKKQLPESEELHEVPEHVENCSIQVPVRRSLRQINKIEKDTTTKTSVNSTIISNMCTEMKKDTAGPVDNKMVKLNSTVVTKTKSEGKNASGEVKDAEIHSKNEYLLKSPSRKHVKRIKLCDVKVVIEKEFNIDFMKTSKDFVTLENEELKKKDNFTVGRPRRKRTYSEPCKSDLSSSDIESVEKDKFKNKKLKSTFKHESSNKSTLPENYRAIEDLANTILEKVEELKRKRKCSSLSEDSAPNEMAKIKKKKNPENKQKEIIDLTSTPSNIVTKPKIKKIRKDNLRYIINDNEPALFSQPDVMIKVKADDSTKKEVKTAFEDKKNQLPMKNSSNISQVTSSIPKSDISNSKSSQPQVKNSGTILQVTDIIPKSDLSEKKVQDIPSQPSSVSKVAPLSDIPNKASELVSEYWPEKDNIKDIDSENSLQIDESIGKSFEEENMKNPEKDSDEIISNTSTEKFNINRDKDNDENICDENMNEQLNSNDPKPKSNIEDLDCDKPIAERKPRRTIKKKEFFEDITARSSTRARKTTGKQKTPSKIEVESEESEEDDPTKLWCICRQPHNDRFMICCDVCEDWFHGNCVGITRQQGRRLEKLQKEWICPNCQKKDKDTDTIVNSTEKKAESEGKKVIAEKIVPEPKEPVSKDIQPSKNVKTVDKTPKTELKSTQGKQISLNSSPSATSMPKNEKSINSDITSKKSFNKNNTSKVAEATSNNKKGSKESTKKKQNCISCQAAVISANSCYCSHKCIEKHIADNLAVIKEERDISKVAEERVSVLDRVKGNVLSGSNAPTIRNIVSWIKDHPNYEIASSTSLSLISKNAQTKKETDSASSRKEKKVKKMSAEEKAQFRSDVCTQLTRRLMQRCKGADDINMSEDEVHKIAVRIEEEINFLYKDICPNYKKIYRRLLFNISDSLNKGLFRKILKGKIPPNKLVRMSHEELASSELAKWREKENQHSLDMIKRVQLEQQSATGLLLKKTHKGEVEIEGDFSIIEDIPKASSKMYSDESGDAEKIESDKEVIKDTTSQHRSHLFDLNCKICTGKVLPPPVDDHIPKKVHVAHSISVDQTSPAALDYVEKSVSRIVDGKSSLSNTKDDSVDQKPSSTVSNRSKLLEMLDLFKEHASPIWKGCIFMRDQASIDAFAYKVSGDTESFDLGFPVTLEICGRIVPDLVWEYLGKIKQSGQKELIIIRFGPVGIYDTFLYSKLFNYLNRRRRCGVVQVDRGYSRRIKDFYILPLLSTSPVPIVLMPFDGPGLPRYRGNTLLGVIVRHKVDTPFPERKQVNSPVFRTENSEDIDKIDGSYTPPLETRSYTPPLPAIQTTVTSPTITHSNDFSPSKTVNSSPSVTILSEYDFCSPSIPHYNNASSPVQSNIIPSSVPSGETELEIFEPSYTPPLHLLIELPKKREDDKPYDPEQDILNINAESENTKCSPKDDQKDSSSNDDLEKHKKILYALTKEVEETDRRVNELRQLMLNPDASNSEYHSPNNQTLDISSVAATGMTSFLDLPENLQDILNTVREKSFSKASKSDVDMRTTNSLNTQPFSTANCHNVSDSDKLINLQNKNNSCSTPPIDNDDENSSDLPCPSDPRIKIKTSFQEPFSEEPANISLSNMSVSELVEKAEKEIADIDEEEKGQDVSPSQEKLPSTDIDSLPPSCWSQFKEPPPPGIELSELASTDSVFSNTVSSSSSSSKSDNSLPSFSSSSVHETQPIAPHFPPPSVPPAFPPPLPPGFSIQTPPPSLKNFPPPSVIATSFPPPPLSVVTKASDINPVNDSWSSWNISSSQSKDSTWRNRVPQWDENWKNSSESALIDCVESSSHYYPPGASEFHNESFYRDESSAESRWNRSSRFSRNNWHKHPPRGGRWRGRRGSFYFNKSQRNG